MKFCEGVGRFLETWRTARRSVPATLSEDDEATGAVFGGEAFVEFALVVFVVALDDDLVEFGDLWFGFLGFGSGRNFSWFLFHGVSFAGGPRWSCRGLRLQ